MVERVAEVGVEIIVLLTERFVTLVSSAAGDATRVGVSDRTRSSAKSADAAEAKARTSSSSVARTFQSIRASTASSDVWSDLFAREGRSVLLDLLSFLSDPDLTTLADILPSIVDCEVDGTMTTELSALMLFLFSVFTVLLLLLLLRAVPRRRAEDEAVRPDSSRTLRWYSVRARSRGARGLGGFDGRETSSGTDSKRESSCVKKEKSVGKSPRSGEGEEE